MLHVDLGLVLKCRRVCSLSRSAIDNVHHPSTFTTSECRAHFISMEMLSLSLVPQCRYHTGSKSINCMHHSMFSQSKCWLHRDMPPPGGFEAVKYKRNLPFRGPSGLVILGAVTAVCAYGFYRVGKGNIERRYVYPHKQAYGVRGL